MMMEEDVFSLQMRYTALVKERKEHVCPTFETYRNIVNDMLEKLRHEKSMVIQDI